jgi:glycosyltransferase involved in cell wall biosynthesis
MRILWISDTPSRPSGFGMVTGQVCDRLRRRDHRLWILGRQTQGGISKWNRIPVLPTDEGQFTVDGVSEYLRSIKPDVVVCLVDPYEVAFITDANFQELLDSLEIRWVMYVPIDGVTPNGILPEEWRRILCSADLCVAMSRFGREVCARCGLAAEYIPHGVDLELFKPVRDKHTAKKRLGYEGQFVVLSDARNQVRKMIPRTLEIFADFASSRHDVLLHMHCDPDDPAASGGVYSYNILEDIDALEISDQVRLTGGMTLEVGGGLPVSELAAIYAASDVQLLCSYGEGFGLPLLQAAAAGVPPIAGAHSASQELVEGHGFAVPSEWVVMDDRGFARHLVDRHEIVKALARLHANREELAKRAQESRRFALNYAWDGIADRWEKVLLQAHCRLTARSVRRGACAGPVGRVNASRLVEGRLCIPVRLMSPLLPNERALPVSITCGEESRRLATWLQRIFPDLTPRALTPGVDALASTPLLAAIARAALVIDLSGQAGPGLDLVCAALGTPYVGPSLLWLASSGSDWRQVRQLLTDQGLSEWHRARAAQAAAEIHGGDAVKELRARVAANRALGISRRLG